MHLVVTGEGNVVLAARNADAELTRLASCRPAINRLGDLALLSIDLDLDFDLAGGCERGKGGDGAATAIAIRQLGPRLRVVFMSGHRGQALVFRGRLAPDARPLDRPFSLHAPRRARGYQS